MEKPKKQRQRDLLRVQHGFQETDSGVVQQLALETCLGTAVSTKTHFDYNEHEWSGEHVNSKGTVS